MLGTGIAQAELRISKVRDLTADWKVMIAGNGVGPAFDIIDKSTRELGRGPQTVDKVEEVLAKYFRERRLDEAGAQGNPNHKLDIQILAAGFDDRGVGHIFTVSNPGLYTRHDVPGFHAIGSGSFGAYYMLLYREIDIYMKASLSLYYAFESKIFGENAPGVGVETDMYIFRKGQQLIKISKRSEATMEAVWRTLRPRWPKPEQRRKLEKLKEIMS
jgi:20S proteasome alpha/beta subunit